MGTAVAQMPQPFWKNMRQEVWKQIQGYEGYYEISTFGNVKSLVRTKQIKEDRIMKVTNHCTGYIIVGLTLNGKQTLFRLHRIVAFHFCDKKIGCNIVNHKNGIKTDNRAENLEWTTVSGNSLHAVEMGLQKVRVGEESNLASLSESDVIQIRQLFSQGCYRQIDLGYRYKVSRTCISLIVNRKTWTHI